MTIPTCVEFIHLISSQANEICDKESRKTISPEHIITALEVSPQVAIFLLQDFFLTRVTTSSLQQLEFNHFIPEIKEVFEEHRTQAKVHLRSLTHLCAYHAPKLNPVRLFFRNR